jgi:daunosaminyl-N,N-dimethyltransferase/N-dimethyltransferase
VYASQADLYDPIHHDKPYAAEARRLRDLLASEGIPDGSRVLEAGCGTGSYLVHLAHWYEVSGFDNSPEMLGLARRKLPRVPLFQADMGDFEVDAPVDALLCLYSAIGYLDGPEHLARTARAFFAALRPGGLLVVEPWIRPEHFRPATSMEVYDGARLKVCRQATSRRDGEMSIMTCHWLVARADDQSVTYFVESHRMWLFSQAAIVETLERAGFDVRVDERGLLEGRGLYVARRL